MKDWTGNGRSVFATLGARNYAHSERAKHDYYATSPQAVEELLKVETFSPVIWECACGEGHISEVLKAHGHNVYSTDLIDRGYGSGGVDFFASPLLRAGADIITNPPYKYALHFVEHALEVLEPGHKAAFLLRIQFLEGKARRKLFDRVCLNVADILREKRRVRSGKQFCTMFRVVCVGKGQYTKHNY